MAKRISHFEREHNAEDYELYLAFLRAPAGTTMKKDAEKALLAHRKLGKTLYGGTNNE